MNNSEDTKLIFEETRMYSPREVKTAIGSYQYAGAPTTVTFRGWWCTKVGCVLSEVVEHTGHGAPDTVECRIILQQKLTHIRLEFCDCVRACVKDADEAFARVVKRFDDEEAALIEKIQTNALRPKVSKP